MYLIFSHKLTEEQKSEICSDLGCADVVSLPGNLQNIWSNVNSAADDILSAANDIIQWLYENTREKDYLLVEGDFGMTFMIVDWALSNERIPVYSTTERRYSSRGRSDGSVTNIHHFRHIKFRRYSRFV